MSQNKETSRKLLEKQQKRLAEEARINAARKAARRRNLVTLGIVLVVLAVVMALVVKDRGKPTELVGVPLADAGCTETEHPALQEAEHIEEGAAHGPYSSDPPTSGPHYGTPADTGFYPTALPTEQVIHNMEHGQIVIWYAPDIEQRELDMVEKITRQEPLANIAIPAINLEPNAKLALTAWGALQFCEEISGEAIDIFRAQFQGKGPEQVGVPVFELPEGLELPEGTETEEPHTEGPHTEGPHTEGPEEPAETPDPEETKKGDGKKN